MHFVDEQTLCAHRLACVAPVPRPPLFGARDSAVTAESATKRRVGQTGDERCRESSCVPGGPDKIIELNSPRSKSGAERRRDR